MRVLGWVLMEDGNELIPKEFVFFSQVAGKITHIF